MLSVRRHSLIHGVKNACLLEYCLLLLQFSDFLLYVFPVYCIYRSLLPSKASYERRDAPSIDSTTGGPKIIYKQKEKLDIFQTIASKIPCLMWHQFHLSLNSKYHLSCTSTCFWDFCTGPDGSPVKTGFASLRVLDRIMRRIFTYPFCNLSGLMIHASASIFWQLPELAGDTLTGTAIIHLGWSSKSYIRLSTGSSPNGWENFFSSSIGICNDIGEMVWVKLKTYWADEPPFTW